MPTQLVLQHKKGRDTHMAHLELSTQDVIWLDYWRVSAMINANDWPEKRFEAIFYENLCHIMCLVIVAHLF
jgi:hypothetical protein